MTLPKESKEQAIKDFQRDPSDTGSPEVQIAILTRRIEQLTVTCARTKRTSIRGMACWAWSASAAGTSHI